MNKYTIIVYKKSESIIIVLMMIFTLLYIIPVYTNDANATLYQPQNNIYVNGIFVINESTIDPLTGLLGQFGLRGNLIVNSTGTLIINNATLYFDEDTSHHFRMFVNGSLIMHNAKITVSTDSLHPYLWLNVSFFNSNVKIFNSKFVFPGNVYFYDSNVLMENSKFMGISNATSIFKSNVYSFSATPFFSGSTVYLYNDYFNDLFSPTPITLVQFGNLSSTPSSYNFTGTEKFTANSIPLPYPSNLEINQINLYIIYKSNSASNVSVFASRIKIGNFSIPSSSNGVAVLNKSIFLSTVLPLNQVESSLFSYIYQNNSRGYTNIISLYYELFTNDTFNYYGGSSNYYINFVNSVVYGMNVFFDVNYYNYTMDNGLLKNPLKNALNLVDSNIYIANMTVNSTLNIPLINQDPPFITDSESNVVIYRYIYLKISNYQGFPINHFDAVFYPEEGNSNANSLASSLNSLLQTNLIGEGLLSPSFNYTMNGKALIPALTDIFNQETSPNTNVFGHYYLDSEGIYANVTLQSFPALTNSSNYRYVKILTNDTFVYYKLLNYTEPVYGSNFTISVNVTSYGNTISGNFLIFNGNSEVYSSPIIRIPSNKSIDFNFNVFDNFKPGNYTLTLEFVSDSMFSSNNPIVFNITSHSNVSILITGYVKPEYSISGNWISGYPGILYLNITNLGSQSPGTFNISINVTYPNGVTENNKVAVELGAKSTFKISEDIYTYNVSSPSELKVTASESFSRNIYPMNTSGSSLKLVYGIIPRPTLDITGIQISGSSFGGMPISGMVSITSNENIGNITLNYQFYNYSGELYVPQVNGEENIPFEIPGQAVQVGLRELTFYYNNENTPFIGGNLKYSTYIYVNPNYEFQVLQSPFLLIGNISDYVNGTDVLYVNSIGLNYTPSVYTELLYAGTSIFTGNVSTDSNFPINISVPYSSNMTLQYILNYDNVLPSSQGQLLYYYTLPIPYYSIVDNIPGSIINGSMLSGNVVINSVSNYPSYNTSVFIKLGNYTILSEYLGNIELSHGTIINLNYNTSQLPAIMQGYNQITYPLILSIQTSYIKPFYINFNIGSIEIIERPNFAVTNITLSPVQIFEGEQFNISFTLINNGGSSYSGKLPYEVVVFSPMPMIIFKSSANISLNPDEFVKITTPEITLSQAIIGTVQIYVNYNNQINTKQIQESNVTVPFNVLIPKMIFSYSVSNTSPVAGQNEILIIRSVNSITNKPWPVNFTLTITLGSKTIYTYTGSTSSSGVVALSFRATEPGNYNLNIFYQIGKTKESYSIPSFLKVKSAPLIIPIYVYPVVIIVIIIVAFMVATSYVNKRTSNLMQCSVCGALIPADSLKCPRCGTEFEKDMVKCSECDSWIPEDSKYCPNCGAVFVSKDEPEYNALVKLKSEYDKFVGEYRAKAKVIFGEKMSEGEFQKWWKSNPEYKGFKEWLIDKGISPDLSNADDSITNGRSRFRFFRK